MGKPNIMNLLTIIAFFAIGLASLLSATYVWDSILFTSLILLISFSLLSIIVVQDISRRRFYTGIFLFGSIYVTATFIPPVESRLLSTIGLLYLDGMRTKPNMTQSSNTTSAPTSNSKYFPGARPDLSKPNIFESYYAWWADRALFAPGSTANFMRIGHSLFAFALAFIGGLLSRIAEKRGLRDGTKSTGLGAVLKKL